MNNLTKKEIQIFGKVLAKIGGIIEKNPSFLLDAIGNVNDSKISHEKEAISAKVESLNLFERFKNIKKSEIESELLRFNREELKFLIKKHSFGSSKLSSVEKLAEYIADQVFKRSTDVFIGQE
jgi:hypothetical protein